ncbi:MAG: thioesterase family protein [candidate division Zixibacteria bacterium]
MSAIKDYYTIKLHDTDAAGILFFANQLRIVHDVYERFLATIGFPFVEMFEKKEFFIPIVHAETDYTQMLTDGDTVEIELVVSEIGKTSFTLEYRLTNLDGIVVGTAKTVHVTIDPVKKQKMDIPEKLRTGLENYLGK